jgi:aminopeptidase 2
MAQGACVVRMLHVVLGAEKFREGLSLYMHKHQYGNTETIDLWSVASVYSSNYAYDSCSSR